MTAIFRRGDFEVSTDPARLDTGAIHAFLTSSYWAKNIPLPLVERSLASSLCFGLYAGKRQIGLARVITDGATYGYLCDVYVLSDYRGQGLGRWLMECVMAHPDLAALRRFMLVTRDAHPLYRHVGFSELAQPERHMEKVRPDPYTRPAGPTPSV
jgi:GNAT superfamily N-acetyltransferase